MNYPGLWFPEKSRDICHAFPDNARPYLACPVDITTALVQGQDNFKGRHDGNYPNQ